ncbi:murein transglycosylase [Fusarium albosuccineum]|uniref:Murein transglycosylase n=1 Tax=Fusarium albosuccineum TaxID=1237068 RepID=A0A8H4P5N6_9HYPO|nr:murein transglycosylase [Fusarium albosuccineum]
MATGYLKVEGNQIVNQNGDPIILRGTSLGGWLNMENFITGHPGTESSTRAAMLPALGQEKYDYFFDRFLYHFFTEDDAKFLQTLGINSLRLAFSYKHFEDDMNPRQLTEGGFKHLDRVIDLCSSHGIYTILDMHTAPGCQNQDWHSDNHTSYAAFWDFKDHQDRTVWLWEALARRYKDNPWIAGYNLLNEPCDSQQTRVAAFCERCEKAIRKLDPNHLLFLNGNTFAIEWKGFTSILLNIVYAIYNYYI